MSSFMENLYNNIGNKIKILAFVIATIGSILSLIFSIVALSNNLIIEFILIIVLGPLFSWISSFILYGFGQIVENSDKNISKLNNLSENTLKKEYKNKNSKTLTNNKITLSSEILEKIATILANLDDSKKNKLKHNYKDWYENIKKLSIENLIEIIKNSNDWQKEYVVLCCIELESRE